LSTCNIDVTIDAPPHISSVLATAIPDDAKSALICGGDARLSLISDIIVAPAPAWVEDLPEDVKEYLVVTGLKVLSSTVSARQAATAPLPPPRSSLLARMSTTMDLGGCRKELLRGLWSGWRLWWESLRGWCGSLDGGGGRRSWFWGWGEKKSRVLESMAIRWRDLRGG